jgi:hypothetical protein
VKFLDWKLLGYFVIVEEFVVTETVDNGIGVQNYAEAK